MSPYPPRRDVTVRLSLRRRTTSVSGYLPKFAQVSRAQGARRCPRSPTPSRASARPEPGVPRLFVRAAAEAVQLRLLASRPHEPPPPPPPPPNLEPLSAPGRSAPSYSQTSVSQFESDPCSEAQSWASSFWKPDCAESEAPRLLHPRPAPRSPGPRVPASAAARRGRSAEYRLGVALVARRSVGLAGLRAAPPPPLPLIHKPLRGRAPSPPEAQ